MSSAVRGIGETETSLGCAPRHAPLAKPPLSRPLPAPAVVRARFLRAHPCPADLNVRRIARLLDHDNHEMRASLRAFLCSPDFVPRYDIDLRAERALALKRLQALTAEPGRFISVRDFLNNPLRVFAAHELIGLADGSLATKLTVQFNLAGGTVLKLGTHRHHGRLLDDIDAMRAVGCFALTELNYGNNAVQMETTAVYDARAEEFVVNTPSIGAQKYWITVRGLCVCGRKCRDGAHSDNGHAFSGGYVEFGSGRAFCRSVCTTHSGWHWAWCARTSSAVARPCDTQTKAWRVHRGYGTQDWV